MNEKMKLGDYLKNEVRDGSRNTYSFVLKSFGKWLDGNINKVEYGPEEVRGFLNYMEEEKEWKPSSKNTSLAIIKSFSKYQIDNINTAFDKPNVRGLDNPSQNEMMQIMMEREEIEDEIEETIERLTRVRNMDRFTVEESASLEGNSLTLRQLNKLIEESDITDRPIIVLYSYHGCRRSELPTYHNLDLEKNSVDFVTLKGRTKKGKRRHFFPDYIGDIYRGAEKGNLKIKYSKDGYYKKIKKYRDVIGHDKLSPLTFRHTFRTLMNDQPVKKQTVKYLMGHKQKDVTDSAYLNQNEDRIKKTMVDNHYYTRRDFELPDRLW